MILLSKLKTSGLPARIIPLVIVFLVILLLMPHSSRWKYEYKKGSTWKYDDLVSEFDFPLMKSEDQILSEKNRSKSYVIPYYNYSEIVVNKALKTAEGLVFEGSNEIRSALLYSLKLVYDKGVVSDDGVRLDDNVNESSAAIYVKRDKRVSKVPATEVYKLSQAREKVLSYVRTRSKIRNLDSLFTSAGVYELVVPNLSFDQQATLLVNSMSDNYVSPTSGFVKSGELVVSKGEIITPEVAQMLESYKKEYEENVGSGSVGLSHVLGNVIISLALVLVLAIGLFLSTPGIFDDLDYYLYVLLVFTIGAAAALVLGHFGVGMLYAFPFAICALFLQAFFKPKVTLMLYSIMLIPLLFSSESGVPLYFMHLSAGTVSLVSVRYFNKGWKQWINALIIFFILAVLYFAFRFLNMLGGNIVKSLSLIFLGSVLTVACYPLLFIFEKMFNLMSDQRLLEYSDTNNELIRSLELKAPGTFQHSLQVMNMSEAAARAIGANPLLVRAGALHHDIGKMLNPLCFVENESLVTEETNVKYHDGIAPEQSAADILRHVPDGYDLAVRHGIPQQIASFILTHHGTGCVTYFYDKFRRSGGDPSRRDDFCYKGNRPTSAEHVIVMLADCIEAASRTLRDYSQESVYKLVDNIVSAKMEEGQFDESEITIKNLDIIKDSFRNYIIQAHHGRVAYPKKSKNKQAL